MRNDPSAPSALVQNIESLAACFKGLAPSEDDIFDADEDSREKDEKVRAVRHDPRLVRLRQRAEGSITGVVVVWTGDGEVADVGSHGVFSVPGYRADINRRYHPSSSTRLSPKHSYLSRLSRSFLLSALRLNVHLQRSGYHSPQPSRCGSTRPQVPSLSRRTSRPRRSSSMRRTSRRDGTSWRMQLRG